MYLKKVRRDFEIDMEISFRRVCYLVVLSVPLGIMRGSE